MGFLKKYIINLNWKPLYEKGWSSRIYAIRILYKNLPEVYDALYDVSNGTSIDQKVKYVAKYGI